MSGFLKKNRDVSGSFNFLERYVCTKEEKESNEFIERKARIAMRRKMLSGKEAYKLRTR